VALVKGQTQRAVEPDVRLGERTITSYMGRVRWLLFRPYTSYITPFAAYEVHYSTVVLFCTCLSLLALSVNPDLYLPFFHIPQ